MHEVRGRRLQLLHELPHVQQEAPARRGGDRVELTMLVMLAALAKLTILSSLYEHLLRFPMALGGGLPASRRGDLVQGGVASQQRSLRW